MFWLVKNMMAVFSFKNKALTSQKAWVLFCCTLLHKWIHITRIPHNGLTKRTKLTWGLCTFSTFWITTELSPKHLASKGEKGQYSFGCNLQLFSWISNRLLLYISGIYLKPLQSLKHLLTSLELSWAVRTHRVHYNGRQSRNLYIKR